MNTSRIPRLIYLIPFLFVSTPSFAAVLKDGDIVVSDEFGEFVRVDPTTGAHNTLFTENEFDDLVASLDPTWHPITLTEFDINSSGKIIVAFSVQSWADGTVTSLVAEINPDLNSIRIITTGGLVGSHSIKDLAIDGNGNIVCVSQDSTVFQIDSSTGEQTQLTAYQYLSFPTGVAFRHNGDIVISDYQNERIVSIDHTTWVQTVFADLAAIYLHPNDIAVDANDNVIVSGTTKLVILDGQTGDVIKTISDSLFDYLSIGELAIESDGNILYSDKSYQIDRVNPSSGLITGVTQYNIIRNYSPV